MRPNIIPLKIEWDYTSATKGGRDAPIDLMIQALHMAETFYFQTLEIKRARDIRYDHKIRNQALQARGWIGTPTSVYEIGRKVLAEITEGEKYGRE